MGEAEVEDAAEGKEKKVQAEDAVKKHRCTLLAHSVTVLQHKVGLCSQASFIRTCPRA